MKLLREWRARRRQREARGLVVTFTGGMGAQILSAAIYLSKRNAGEEVYADLSYFDAQEKVATEGRPGEISQWAWQLDRFGMSRSSFEARPGGLVGADVLADGPRKLQMALQALERPDIRARFPVGAGVADLLPVDGQTPYLCIHVRRGDYVNVASHLVSDEAFIACARDWVGLLDHVVVLSDSPVPAPMRQALSAMFKHAHFPDGLDAFASHRVMRCARVLVCSNSQFSLIAAVLNRQAMVLLPRKWFDGDAREIEAPIHERCTFQVLSAGGPS
jgi:hypothetical protein